MINPQEFESLFSTPLGKKVLADLIEQFYDNSEFTKEPLEVMFNTGRRNVIQFIKIQIKTAQMPKQSEESDNE